MASGNLNGDDSMETETRGKALVHVLAFVLERMVAANASPVDEHEPTTKFHALRPPSIAIREYLLRIFKYASCSPECFVLSLIYIDRFIQHSNVKLNAFNVHRIVITSVVLAAKFFDDQYFNNSYYAKVGGIPCVEMNQLELEFLFRVNFTLHVTSERYTHYYNELANHIVFTNALASFTNVAVSSPLSEHKVVSSPTSVRHFIAQDPLRDNQLTYYTHEDEVAALGKIDVDDNQLAGYQKCAGQKRRSVALGVQA